MIRYQYQQNKHAARVKFGQIKQMRTTEGETNEEKNSNCIISWLLENV